MSVYRTTRNPNRTRTLFLIVILGLALPLATVFLMTRATTPPAEPSQIDIVAQSIDVFEIEYAKVRAGAAISTTGALDSLDRAFKVAEAIPNAQKIRQLLTELRVRVGKDHPDVSAEVASILSELDTARKAQGRP